MQWMTDNLFASVPEVGGHVPLVIAFSQFVAVECDQDPLDRDLLYEDLSCASCAQQVMRWLLRLLQAGELRGSSRPLGGGNLSAIPATHWQADEVRKRFHKGQYSRAHPFVPEAEADSWIFLDEKDLTRLWRERAEERIVRKVPKARKRSEAPRPGWALVASGDPRLLGIRDVERMVGFRRTKIYAMAKTGDFPSSTRIGGRALWSSEELKAWIEAQTRASEEKPVARQTNETG